MSEAKPDPLPEPLSPPLPETARRRDGRADDIVRALGRRCIVLVGIMGSGKTSAGRRLAMRLGLHFVDSDVEIEIAHKLSIVEIFARYGEPYFRDGERRVVQRLLARGPCVIAVGGGAYMNEQTRENIREQGVSVWLNGSHELLMRRVRKRPTRPLLNTPNPDETMRQLMEQRYPIYAKADVEIPARDVHLDEIVEDIVQRLHNYLYSSNGPVNQSAPHTNSVCVSQAYPDQACPNYESSPVLKPADSLCIVPVALGDRSYDIVIGPDLIAGAGARIANLSPERAGRVACAVVTDENVAKFYLAPLQKSLDAAGLRHLAVVLPPGEASKCYKNFEWICEEVIAGKIERGDFVIALGGGVMGDLAGFAAACVRRGIRFVQIPTSLLAQVDSSVGGKTGINSPRGKNLIGAFYQPSLVLADSQTLDTLAPREFRAGYAEIAKYGLIDDAPFFYWLEENWRAIFADQPQRIEAIAKSCMAKAAVVARDETEQGDRALLNLGHTFGHALERLTGYDGARLVHGEGVAIGMALAFRFSNKLELCPGQDSARVCAHLKTVGLPTRICDIADWDHDTDALINAMYQDKKVQSGALTFILARGVGKSFIAKNVDVSSLKTFLTEELAQGPSR